VVAEDCVGLGIYSTFMHPENVYCDIGEGCDSTCRECKVDSDCPDEGALCASAKYCILMESCTQSEDCGINDIYHDGCVDGWCALCTADSHCMSNEICWEIPVVPGGGACVDADRVEQSCVDGSCEVCTMTYDEDGLINNVICADPKSATH